MCGNQVLVTSNRTALIELVPDSLSVHTIKAKSPPGWSLSDHFFAKFGRGSPACLAAQRAFAESMAGYSIACHLLQIKVGQPSSCMSSSNETKQIRQESTRPLHLQRLIRRLGTSTFCSASGEVNVAARECFPGLAVAAAANFSV